MGLQHRPVHPASAAPSEACVCCDFSFCLVVEASILREKGGCTPPPSHQRGEKSAEFCAGGGGGGMGPIHAEHYHFDCFDAVFGCGGVGSEKRDTESPVSTAAHSQVFNHHAD